MNIREEHDKSKAEAVEILSKAKTEARGLTADEKVEVEKRFSRCSELSELDKTEKTAAALVIKDEAVAETVVKTVATSTFSKEAPKMEANSIADMRSAINTFARSGEIKTYSLNSTANSANLMPKDIPGVAVARTYANAIRRAFGRLGLKPQISAAYSDNMSIPIFNDSANAATTAAEGVTNTNTDATYSANLTLNLVEYHSEPQFVTKKVLNVDDYSILDALVPAAQNRIDRKEEADWVARLKTVAGTTYTTLTGGVFALADLLGFVDSLGGVYAGVPKVMLVSQDLKTKMGALTDSNGRPIFDILAEMLAFRGIVIEVSPNLSVVAATNTCAVLFAIDGLSGTVIRDYSLNELVRYEGVIGYAGQVGIEALGWSALDAAAAAVAKLVIHA